MDMLGSIGILGSEGSMGMLGSEDSEGSMRVVWVVCEGSVRVVGVCWVVGVVGSGPPAVVDSCHIPAKILGHRSP